MFNLRLVLALAVLLEFQPTVTQAFGAAPEAIWPVVLLSWIVAIGAWVLAGVIGHLGPDQVTLWNGIVSGFLLWLGFIATTLAVNHRYQNFGWDLTAIDAGHWLGVCLIMGAIIGWWG
jgi:hypothetical protein